MEFLSAVEVRDKLEQLFNTPEFLNTPNEYKVEVVDGSIKVTKVIGSMWDYGPKHCKKTVSSFMVNTEEDIKWFYEQAIEIFKEQESEFDKLSKARSHINDELMKFTSQTNLRVSRGQRVVSPDGSVKFVINGVELTEEQLKALEGGE